MCHCHVINTINHRGKRDGSLFQGGLGSWRLSLLLNITTCDNSKFPRKLVFISSFGLKLLFWYITFKFHEQGVVGWWDLFAINCMFMFSNNMWQQSGIYLNVSNEYETLINLILLVFIADGLIAAKRLIWPKALPRSGARWLTPAGTTPPRLARGCLFPS